MKLKLMKFKNNPGHTIYITLPEFSKLTTENFRRNNKF